MESDPKSQTSKRKIQKPPKLKRLPKNARIQKRPLLHPAIPSPYAGANQPKVIYISHSTPFVSVVKRVRKLLALVDKRSMGKVDLFDKRLNEKQRLKAIGKQDKEAEEVLLKATGKAIEKVLGLALFFQGQDDLIVRLRTGSVGAVDDIVEVEQPEVSSKQTSAGVIQDQEKSGIVMNEEEDVDLPETQVRKTSMVEVGISLR